MLFLEVVRRRMGNYALEIEAERVGDDEAFRRFCATEQADLIITTRAIAEDEMLRCTEKLNWRAKSIRATKLGHIGVVISAAKTATVQRLSPREIYLALAKRIPNPANPTRFIPNPNVSWHQVHGVGYREGRITFFGPERDSLLARVFAALILRAGCDTFPSIKALSDADPEQYHRICHEIREDSVYTPVYEGEFFLTQTLWGDPDALALLSLPFFDTHRTELNGSLLSGALPTKEAIASDAYEGAATLHLYVRGDKTGSTRLADELASERAIGPVGYLLSHGLIPLDTRGSLSPLNEPVP
jgi:phosphate transport system substrate-binding protein